MTLFPAHVGGRAGAGLLGEPGPAADAVLGGREGTLCHQSRSAPGSAGTHPAQGTSRGEAGSVWRVVLPPRPSLPQPEGGHWGNGCLRRPALPRLHPRASGGLRTRHGRRCPRPAVPAGLSCEGWSIMKNMATELGIILIGYFTLVPAIQVRPGAQCSSSRRGARLQHGSACDLVLCHSAAGRGAGGTRQLALPIQADTVPKRVSSSGPTPAVPSPSPMS